MRPPQIALAIALSPGRLAAVAVILAMVAVVALLVVLRRQELAPGQWTDVNEPLKRLRAFHIFGPDEEQEAVVHVPVMRESGAADAALARAAAFAERQPVALSASADRAEEAPPPAPLVQQPVARAQPVAPVVHHALAPVRTSAPQPPARTKAPHALDRPVPPLPARRVASTALPPATSAPASSAPSAPAPPESPTRKRGELPLDGDILLVEDDAAIASMYQLMLTSRGYTARHAHDGVEGIAMVRDRRPALILLDMMMPRMDGLQFLEALRGWPKTSFIPVVVLSNADNLHLVDRAMALGAVEYLVKAQARPQVIVGALPHWLRGNRALSGVS